MENKQMKCIKGESCLYCGSNYCRFVDELDQLKAELEQETALKETYLACYKAKHEDIEGALFKLKATLTEIKEIVYLLNDRTMVRKDICDRLDLILQKISEVLDEEI